MQRVLNLRVLFNKPTPIRGLSDIVKPDNTVIQAVRSAKDPLEVMDIVSSNKFLNTKETVQCLRSLFQLQKAGEGKIQTQHLVKHPEFETLCHRLSKNSRNLDANETIEALKILSFLGIESNSRIVVQLLNIVKHQINDVTLAHLVFMDFLIRKFEPTPLVQALTIALPMLFQAQLSIQMDHENVKELAECLSFAGRNKISEKSTMSIVTALTLHGEDLPVQIACSILWSLCDISYKREHDKLLRNCFAVVTREIDELSFTKIESTLTRVIEKYRQLSYANVFYNEPFLEKVAEATVKYDNGPQKICHILKKLNKLNFVNYELLNNLTSRLIKDPSFLETCSAGYIYTIVTAYSTANYINSDIETLLEFIQRNPVFTSDKHEFPWMKFVLEFFSIGGFSETLLRNIFHPEFLTKHFDRENNGLDYLALLRLTQCIKTLQPYYTGPFPDDKYIEHARNLRKIENLPLLPSLKYIYGEKQLFNKAQTKLGHILDHVIAFDMDNKVLDLNEMEIENVLLEELQHPERKLVAVISPPSNHYIQNYPEKLKGVFELQHRGIETIVPTVVISQKIFKTLADCEKLPYLQQQIEDKLR